MKTLKILIPVVFLALLLGGAALGQGRPSHMDKDKNPRGCVACHAGRSAPGTPMLRKRAEELCFDCHGLDSRGARTDIETLFTKVSRHPVSETAKFHSPGERLPEEHVTDPRHVSCADCHVTHLSDETLSWRGARGYQPGPERRGGAGRPPGLRLGQADEEYHLCYLCHSDGANLPMGARNVAAELNPTNASFHPVEAVGRNRDVPSLLRQLSANSRISCGNCHGNDDPVGPRGPHGSDYFPLLRAEYRTSDGSENAKAYELCYACHDRRSILSDESFKQHNLHVVLGRTSCFACHSSHGSELNTGLIRFNPDAASSSGLSGGPRFFEGPGGAARCFLACHGADHSMDGIDVPGVGLKPWPP